jgi:hypothetical protein
MFSFPVTIPCRTDESVFPVFVSVNVDDILLVKPLLDNEPPFGVESASSDLIPLCELVFQDGRRLPILETPHTIHCYLDAYLDIEDYYTEEHGVAVNERVEHEVEGRDNVVPLFGSKSPCATSEGSTPD